MTRPHEVLNFPFAIISLSSPWWLPVLEKVSQFSAMMIPIVVLSYWIFSFGLKIFDRFKAKKP